MISPILDLVALLFLGIGFALRKGHTNLLHSYHRQRVKEEDLPALGKLTGLGMILIGCATAVFCGFFDAAQMTDNRSLLFVGISILFAGLAAGITVLLYAVRRYNNGIF